jgi:hypothetical protein
MVGIRLTKPWLMYRLSDWAEGCPVALEEGNMENIPQWKASALDRLQNTDHRL